MKMSFDPGQTDLVSPFNLKLKETLSVGESIYVFKLTEPKNFDPFKVCDALRQRAEVVWAEPNMAQEIQQSVIPNDISFASQWNLRNTGQTAAFSDADVDADEAWDGSQSYGSEPREQDRFIFIPSIRQNGGLFGEYKVEKLLNEKIATHRAFQER